MRLTRGQLAVVFVVASLVAVPVAGAVEGDLSPLGSTAAPSASPDAELADGIDEELPRDADELRAHTADHSGEGATVGVVGTAFAPDHPAIASDVAGHRRLAPADPFDSTDHDTAVAEVVTRTAPGSELYLAEVGSAPTPERYARAIEWLVAQDVDVIVDSGSYFPTVGGDGERVEAAAAEATDAGVVFVTSAGNYAGRHWAGEGASDGWVTFGPGDQANELAGGDRISGRVSLRLRWQSAADYDLYLYRRLPGGDAVVAESTARESSAERSVEAIDVAVPEGRYYVAVRAHDGVGRPGEIQLFAAHNSLEHTTERGSMVAPATSQSVIAVGALRAGETASYSSRGGDGETDVAAPGSFDTAVSGPLNGTSAAAPYVAGTAAVVASGGEDLSPREIERILASTSGDRGVDAAAAVGAATNDSDDGTPTTNESAAGEAGDGRQSSDDADRRREDERSSSEGTDGQRDEDRSRSDRDQRRDDGRSDDAGDQDEDDRRSGDGSERRRGEGDRDRSDGRDRRSDGGGHDASRSSSGATTRGG